MKQKIITILFCVLLCAGLCAGLLMPDRDYSEHERRSLMQLPKPTAATVRSGAFGSDLETYLSDQFPMRDAWVTVKTLADRLSGKKESGGVYFADDGFLIEIHSTLNTSQMQKNLSAVKELSDRLDGIPVWFMPAPTASCVLSNLLPAYAPNADQQTVISAAKDAGIRTVDVAEPLKSHQNEYIYYKTDHHWTSLGAYYAYAAWMDEKGESARPLSDWQTETLSDSFRGTTFAKVNDPFAAYDTLTAYYRGAHHVSYNQGSYEADSIYERSALSGSDPYAVYCNSNQAETVITGSGTGKLLLLKDSYANTFAQFPVEDYEEVHMIDLRFFRKSVPEYIREHGITEVLVLYNIPNFCEDTDIARCAK